MQKLSNRTTQIAKFAVLTICLVLFESRGGAENPVLAGTGGTCWNVVPYNSIDGAVAGDTCYKNCTAGATRCEIGSTFLTCTEAPSSMTCVKGVWRKNLDGTGGCYGTGIPTTKVFATIAAGAGSC